MTIREIDLVLHDWASLPDAEKEQALKDIKETAGKFEGRRARAIHIVASFFHFLNEEAKKDG